jgi:aminoglycoside 6'-N-acetyltransferase I
MPLSPLAAPYPQNEGQDVKKEDAIRIAKCGPDDLNVWAALRHDLWPDAAKEELRLEAALLMQHFPARAVTFLAWAEQAPTGFAEARLRADYVNGCDTSPVAFLEGIYVHPAWRRRGIARRLCRVVEEWSAGLGCTELASDALLDNMASHQMHTSLEFEETERVVYYRKRLQRP